MTRPLPPHSGRSTRNKPNLRANRHPGRRPARLASEISSTEIQTVRIRFSEKLISRFSACPRLRIDRGSTASVTLVYPRSLRASKSIETAAADSSPTLKYIPTRKSLSMNRCSPARISREMTGRCSLCWAQVQRRLTGSCPLITDTSMKSSMYGMFRAYCWIKRIVAAVMAPQTAQARTGPAKSWARAHRGCPRRRTRVSIATLLSCHCCPRPLGSTWSRMSPSRRPPAHASCDQFVRR